MATTAVFKVYNGSAWVEYTFTPSAHTHTKSQITDFPTSLPASDVYSWAKASTKPSYTYSEVGAASSEHTHSQYLTAHQSLSNYSTLANTVKTLTISGKVITYTLGSGTTGTLTTQDTVYAHPTTTAVSAAAVKVGKDSAGHVVIGSALTYSDVGAASSGHTHSGYATTSHTHTVSQVTNLPYILSTGEYSDMTAYEDAAIPTTGALVNYVSDNYSVTTHTHSNYAPTSHASSGTTYGVASTTNFGHVKIGSGITVSGGVISVSGGSSSSVTVTTLTPSSTTNTILLSASSSSRSITLPSSYTPANGDRLVLIWNFYSAQSVSIEIKLYTGAYSTAVNGTGYTKFKHNGAGEIFAYTSYSGTTTVYLGIVMSSTVTGNNSTGYLAGCRLIRGLW